MHVWVKYDVILINSWSSFNASPILHVLHINLFHILYYFLKVHHWFLQLLIFLLIIKEVLAKLNCVFNFGFHSLDLLYLVLELLLKVLLVCILLIFLVFMTLLHHFSLFVLTFLLLFHLFISGGVEVNDFYNLICWFVIQIGDGGYWCMRELWRLGVWIEGVEQRKIWIVIRRYSWRGVSGFAKW